MAIDAIGSTAASSTTSDLPKNAAIGQDDFMRILLAQLRFQDPMKPVDNEQFVAQLAQFSSLEINRQQSDKIESMLSIQATNQAVALVGKSVELRTSTGSSAGNVTAVSFSTGSPLLTVTATGGATFVDVKLSDVVLVR